MIRPALLLLAALALGAAGVSVADVAQHKARMDAADEIKLDLDEAITGRKPDALKAAAAKLVPLIEAEHRFWLSAEVPAAVPLSSANLAQARTFKAAADAGDWARVGAAWTALNRSCSACHDAHPERQLKPR